MWDAPQARWDVVRPTGPDYHCDIFEDEVQMAGQVGPIDGQPPLNPRTPAPSTEDEEQSERSSKTVESGIPGNTTEEEGLANLAESIHINSPIMATMTETREQVGSSKPTYLRREITEGIDPYTGHHNE